MPKPRIQDEVAPKGNVEVFHLLGNRLLRLKLKRNLTTHYAMKQVKGL